MHTPDLQPQRSSYFDYRVFPFVRPPAFGDRPGAPVPVVVIGAGPVGLVSAIQLAANGVRCIVIESDAQVCGGSRALALARRSMEIVEQCGCAAEFLADAIVWREGFSYHQGAVVHHLDIPASPDDKFSPMTNIAQCAIEAHLVDRALALGVEIRFQTRLIALDASATGVRLTLDTPDGEYRLATDWLLACDGARSSVRRLAGLRFEGTSWESRFVISDFVMDLDAPAGRRCYFDPPWLPGQTVLMHKAPDNVWRLDYQVPAGMSDEAALEPARIRANIQAHLDYIGVDRPWTVEWTTLYKPNALTLSRYDHGRLLFCGDAAHLLPVFGVRGLNTGIQDAMNVGWKLALVVRGLADPALLASYSDERVADARQICVDAAKSTRMVAPPTEGYRILQQAVLTLAHGHAFVRDLLHWRTSRPIEYADSPLSVVDPTDDRFDDGPRPGAFPRNAWLSRPPTPATGEAGALPDTDFLLDAVEPAFNLLVFAADAAQCASLAAETRPLRARGLPIRLVAVVRQPVRLDDADTVVVDPEGNAHRGWGAEDGGIYLLRPDQHVASRWKPDGRIRLTGLLDRICHPDTGDQPR